MKTLTSLLLLALLWPALLPAQSLISGRIRGDRFPGSEEQFIYAGIHCFASRDGSGAEPAAFRSWETDPAGWYRLSGVAGNQTLLFAQPAHFFRPVVRFNVFTRSGEKIDPLIITPAFDFHHFHEKEWDPKPAAAYYQTFVARGRSVTQVGFRLATDGVDGAGSKGQNLLVSIHRRGPGTPDSWEQIGPAAPVLNVDCGGPKNYTWSAGWNSGEVPLVPGGTYAVRLKAESPTGTFQTFWRQHEGAEECYRVGADGTGFQPRRLWLAVGTDGDGLLIPFNKRVHQQFGAFAGFASKWAQTYRAQGRGLAGVLLYAAVGGAQPPLSRQRVTVRVRRGAPDGPVVGVEKIAVGNGNYTGDASWGVFGAAFAPGEVPLTPGETYAIEWESIENYETLHGFVNIKGQVSDERPGFNPYRKFPGDEKATGAAWKSDERVDFDLDAQIIEYERVAPESRWPTDAANLLRNGDMEAASTTADGASAPAQWKSFQGDLKTRHVHTVEQPAGTNHFARVFAEGGQTMDGGWVQRVEGLSRFETYRLTGRVRASWATDFEHQLQVGLDPSGQEDDPTAASIVWQTEPERHGVFLEFTSEPVRPATNAISVWLRGRSTFKDDKFAPYKADFDDFALRRVRTEP